jgi:hypothetical protein
MITSYLVTWLDSYVTDHYFRRGGVWQERLTD